LVSAAWSASMVQVPTPTKLTSELVKVHTAVVALVKVTGLVEPPPVAVTV
jgi:hypothetical protein